MPELLSTAQAAERLNISPKTVRRLMLDGTLPAYKVGRALRFKETDLKRAMKPVKVYAGSKAGEGLD